MATELPYYKFYPGEWIKGDITICSMAAQGLFTNICAFYWSKQGVLTLTTIQHRFNTCSTELQELFDNEIFDVDGDYIKIKFLDKQLSQFKNLSKKKSAAGKASAKVRKANTRSTPVQQMHNKEEVEVEVEVEVDNNPPKSPQGDPPEEKESPEEIFLKRVPEELNTPKFQVVWFDEWIPYRTESRFKNAGYTKRGLKGTLTRLNNDSKKNVSTAIKIIRQSIDMSYQGLFPLKNNHKANTSTHGTRATSHFDAVDHDEEEITIRK